MAIASPPNSGILTYAAYLSEGVVSQRYDIIEGVRVFMSAPTWQHQRIQANIVFLLRGYEVASGRGFVVAAPFDVLIRRTPRLQTRQPDVLFISTTTLAQGGGIPAHGPLTVAPELIVEVLSDSERESTVADKLADYTQIGTQEAWLVRPAEKTLEVLRLEPVGPVSVAKYTEQETVQSLVFPDLALIAAGIFRP